MFTIFIHHNLITTIFKLNVTLIYGKLHVYVSRQYYIYNIASYFLLQDKYVTESIRDI